MSVRIFKVNDCDWYLGETVDAAIAAAMSDTGLPRDEAVDEDVLHELSDAELDRLRFITDDDKPVKIADARPADAAVVDIRFATTRDRWIYGVTYYAATDVFRNSDDGDSFPALSIYKWRPRSRSFREELARRVAAGETSGMFASTEY